jgi:hypothetical protein
MSDFDWVTERANCSVQKVFRSLELGVKGDVDKRNALLKTGEPKVETASRGERFTVFRKGRDGTRVVEFAFDDDGISVTSDNVTLFHAALTIHNSGQCRLKVNKQELEEWQVRRKALEDLFFQSVN